MQIISLRLTKTTAARNEDALSHHKVRGLYFLAVVFAATLYMIECLGSLLNKDKVTSSRNKSNMKSSCIKWC